MVTMMAIEIQKIAFQIQAVCPNCLSCTFEPHATMCFPGVKRGAKQLVYLGPAFIVDQPNKRSYIPLQALGYSDIITQTQANNWVAQIQDYLLHNK